LGEKKEKTDIREPKFKARETDLHLNFLRAGKRRTQQLRGRLWQEKRVRRSAPQKKKPYTFERGAKKENLSQKGKRGGKGLAGKNVISSGTASLGGRKGDRAVKRTLLGSLGQMGSSGNATGGGEPPARLTGKRAAAVSGRTRHARRGAPKTGRETTGSTKRKI